MVSNTSIMSQNSLFLCVFFFFLSTDPFSCQRLSALLRMRGVKNAFHFLNGEHQPRVYSQNNNKKELTLHPRKSREYHVHSKSYFVRDSTCFFRWMQTDTGENITREGEGERGRGREGGREREEGREGGRGREGEGERDGERGRKGGSERERERERENSI